MIKEMYVSSTPHETKVAITEDDQLAEIFFERENEYTLAGSIYKGRVTRVLPGMQSAFVDIGLERDAFLYVSDFLDLGELDEDELEEVPVRAETYVTNRPANTEATRAATEFLKAVQDPNASLVETAGESDADDEFDEADEEAIDLNAEASPEANRRAPIDRDNSRFGGRGRRRRGRRGRPVQDTSYARPFASAADNFEAVEEDISPEQSPIALPGESLSKYRRQQDADVVPVEPPLDTLEDEESRTERPYDRERPQRRDRGDRYERRDRSERYERPRELPPTEAVSIGAPVLLPGETRRKLNQTAVDPAHVTEPTASPEAATPIEQPTAEPSPAATSNELNPEIVSTMPVIPPTPAAPATIESREPVWTLPGESLRKYRREEPKVETTVPEIAAESQVVEEPVAEPLSESPTAEAVLETTPTPEPQAVEPVVAPEPVKPVDEEPTEGSARVSGPSSVAPLLLPGETLKKYSRRRKKAEVVPEETPVAPAETVAAAEEMEQVPVAERATEAGEGDATPVLNSLDVAPVLGTTDAEAETVAGTETSAEEAATGDVPVAEEPINVALNENVEPVDASSEAAPPQPAATEFVNEQSAEAEAQLADARPHVEADERVVEEAVYAEPDAAVTQRFEHPAFQPAAQGTLEHEEIETDELPDDEHEFREVSEIGAYEDASFDEEFEEQTLDAGSDEEPDDEELAAAGAPFVIEGGFEVEGGEDIAGDDEDEEDEEFVEGSTSAPAQNRDFQRRPLDRRRGRRGGRRIPTGRPPRRDAQRQSIQIGDLLKEGQEVLIQIAKEPIGKKGARITSHIALPGRYLVYMPTVNHIGVSRKINSDEERQRLKRIMISEREGGHGGFIVRTAAAGIGEDDLRADIRFLKNLWQEIRTRADHSKSPALIYHDLNLVERVLRDQVTSDFSTIWVDTESEYERILRFANRFQPSLVRKVKLYTKDTPLYEQFGIQEELNRAMKAKVWLKSGGYIVINQTEALVAIDINTGKYVGKTQRLEDTIVKTNIDAIREIVRQIRLRDLGGIIIIDFIDMDERKNRQKVMQELELAMRADRSPSKILAFNDFGLVAITRKRVKQSLERTLGAPCTYCTGTGYTKSVNTMCNEIFIEMRKLTRQLEKDDVVLRVNPDVAKALKGGRWLQEMEDLTRRNIIVKSDAMLHVEQYDFN